ncbi:MFS transporter [Polycladidibacter stylochi]|uniref:MFS transporter n=1 Tax=Polycladidibacter stylochi TaxID=1807766 RepID=UPI000832EF91|nr:MFS transporter [Pseudovibrio stylochi]
MAALFSTIAALLISVVLLIVGHGLTSTLIPLRASSAGFGDLEIGLVSSSFYLGYVVGCFYGPYLILRAGHIRTFAALVSLMSGAAILHPVIIEPISWSVFRFITGACLAGITLVVESWLNERSTNENRGAVMSTYVVLYLSATMVGQVLLPQFDLMTFIPFVIASVLVSVAVVPVALTRSAQPAPIALVHFRPKRLYDTSPIALVGCLLVGLANGALWMLTPLYATQVGFSSSQAAYLAAAIVFGGTLAQWPIGRLSDRIDRRAIIVFLAGFSFVFAALIMNSHANSFLVFVLLFTLLGTVTQPIYAIIAAHAFDSADAEDYVEVSSGLLMASGLGSMIGPTLASLLIGNKGPQGLLSWVAAIEVVLFIYVLSRMLVRPPLESEDKTDFELGTTSSVGAALTPEPLDVDDPNVIPPEEFPAYETTEVENEIEEEKIQELK